MYTILKRNLHTLRKHWLTRTADDLARTQLSVFWLWGLLQFGIDCDQILTGQPGQGNAAVNGVGAGWLSADSDIVSEATIVANVDSIGTNMAVTMLSVTTTIVLAGSSPVRVQLATTVQAFLPQTILASKFGLVLAIPAII